MSDGQPIAAAPTGSAPSPDWSVAPPAPRRRRRTRWAVLAVVVALLAGLGIWIGSDQSGSSSATPQQAEKLLRSSLAAAEASGSFHYRSSSTSSKPSIPAEKQLTVGDAGTSKGAQAITVSGHRFEVVVIGSATYFRGDAPSMAGILQLPAAMAEAHAGQWISLSPGDAPYQSVEVAVTASSALAENVTFRATSELGTSSIGGTKVIGLRGPMTPVAGQGARGTGTLYVAARGRHLPVAYREQGSVGPRSDKSQLSFSLTFSSWGEPVVATAPTTVVPFSSLGVGAGGAPTSSGPTLLTATWR